MADRCSASIVIGGAIAAGDLPALLAQIKAEGLGLDFDGPEVTADDLLTGEEVLLAAHEVSWGIFSNLEAFCREHRLPYTRWNGACSGVWGCGRTVYRGIQTEDGKDVIDEYDVSEDDHVFVGEGLARHLGSYEAILDHFASANFRVPPLRVVAPGPIQTDPTARPG